MKDDFPRYTLRIPQILLDKIGYIAEYEGRTKNKEIEQLMNNAKDENEGCVSIELVAEFCVLQEELYQEALKKHKEEAN